MDKPEMRLTADGEAKANSWKQAQIHLRRTESELNRARCDLANATNAFGKWLMPPDAKKGEIASVWMGDTLVQAEMIDMHSFKVSLRFRGREWDRR